MYYRDTILAGCTKLVALRAVSVTDSVVTKPVSGVTESVTDDSVSSSTD